MMPIFINVTTNNSPQPMQQNISDPPARNEELGISAARLRGVEDRGTRGCQGQERVAGDGDCTRVL